MDLALELGTTANALSRVMTERELHEWALYVRRRMLPQRRLELLLAQVALLIAKTMGGVKDAKLSDYLFDPSEELTDEGDAEEFTAEDVAAMFGGVIVRETKQDG